MRFKILFISVHEIIARYKAQSETAFKLSIKWKKRESNQSKYRIEFFRCNKHGDFTFCGCNLGRMSHMDLQMNLLDIVKH